MTLSVRSFEERAADALAYECAKMVLCGRLDPRSGIGDALLDYLGIGMPGKPQDVPAWMAEYEKRNN